MATELAEVLALSSASQNEAGDPSDRSSSKGIFPFMKLPVEIRIMIYGFSLSYDSSQSKLPGIYASQLTQHSPRCSSKDREPSTEHEPFRVVMGHSYEVEVLPTQERRRDTKIQSVHAIHAAPEQRDACRSYLGA